jgi:hypothetical protein
MGGAHITAAQDIVEKVERVLLFPFMILLSSIALLVFIWGVYEYILNSGDEKARATGRMHMMYGVIGLLVMVSAYAILKVDVIE